MLRYEDILNKILSEKKSTLGTKEVDTTTADKLAAFIIYNLSNKTVFKFYLNELSREVSKCVSDMSLPLPPHEYAPVFNVDLPYPPEVEFTDGNKLIIAFEQVLLTQEQRNGVNLGRTPENIAIFLGNVYNKIANDFVINGGLWNDSNFDLTGFLHGYYSHRIQHYILSRIVEDSGDTLNEILPPSERKILFKHLIQNSFIFQIKANNDLFSRSYWNISLDNDFTRKESVLIATKPTISAPVVLMEYLLSPQAFTNWPHLAHTLYHSYCLPLFNLAQDAKISSQEAFKLYAREITRGEVSDTNMLSSLISYVEKTTNHPNFFSAGEGYAGILNLNIPQPKQKNIAESIPLKKGFFENKDNKINNIKKNLFQKYVIKNPSNEKDDLEKILRNAAANGNVKDLEDLLTFFKVNVNAVDEKGKRSALHWAVIKAYEKKSKFDDYEQCVKLLLKYGADTSMIDSENKSCKNHDKENLLNFEQTIAPINKNP